MQTRGPKSGFRKTLSLRRILRHNLTPAEKLFWTMVSNKKFYNLKFRKQHGIGNYIVDFYCSEKQLIIEIDGDSHFDKEGVDNDKIRTQYLESFGYKVIRYNNKSIIQNLEGVYQDLSSKLGLL